MKKRIKRKVRKVVKLERTNDYRSFRLSFLYIYIFYAEWAYFNLSSRTIKKWKKNLNKKN